MRKMHAMSSWNKPAEAARRFALCCVLDLHMEELATRHGFRYWTGLDLRLRFPWKFVSNFASVLRDLM